MKMYKREKEEVLKNILLNYLDKKTVTELIKKPAVKLSTGKTIKISARNRHILNKKIEEAIQTGLPIDFIITKAELQLPGNKFLRLLGKLGDYTTSNGEFSSAVYIYEKLAGISRSIPKLTKLLGDSLLALGNIFSRQALWGISLNYINDAYVTYKKINNTKGCADCENLLGAIYGELGDLNQAQIHFENALLFLRDKKDAAIKGKVEINLGIINNIQGNYDIALKYFNSALKIFSSFKDLKRIAEIRHNIGMLHSKMHKYEQAIEEFDQSINLSSRRKYLPLLGVSYLGKAVVYAIREDYELSSLFAGKALEVCDKLNDRLSVADVYKVKGIIYRDTKNYKLAEDYLRTSLRINSELNNKLNKAETEFELGLLYKIMGRLKESNIAFLSAKRYFSRVGALTEVKEIDRQLKIKKS